MRNYVIVEDATSKICGFISLSGGSPFLSDGQTAYEVSRDTLDAVRLRDKSATDVAWDPDECEIVFREKDSAILANIAWIDLRAKRDRSLSESDKRVLPDFPDPDGLRDAWIIYRQELRDLPANTTDPLNPVWPVPPG